VNKIKAEDWNSKYPIGTKVRYWPIKGIEKEYIDTTTRSEAWELGHGEVIVKIVGRTGGCAISHMAVLEE